MLYLHLSKPRDPLLLKSRDKLWCCLNFSKDSKPCNIWRPRKYTNFEKYQLLIQIHRKDQQVRLDSIRLDLENDFFKQKNDMISKNLAKIFCNKKCRPWMLSTRDSQSLREKWAKMQSKCWVWNWGIEQLLISFKEGRFRKDWWWLIQFYRSV